MDVYITYFGNKLTLTSNNILPKNTFGLPWHRLDNSKYAYVNCLVQNVPVVWECEISAPPQQITVINP
jgi:hypothetical protein